ncbi:MAG: hypothetical protein A3H96_27460 [Acidobacteria bacterium RIFCSPLOWO2_02_FULL_67_36]|nr:MAG: hypothetical protein A3H96_27460 [Acidobacteria bacterium RIFCSPLOWO2_02_FULL_67_36]OFW26405.1 MAG: hypothetical protein A3G21_27385 [Acidobacteria bacterium RIFCSPLOWO2_12_FULL_66_21]
MVRLAADDSRQQRGNAVGVRIRRASPAAWFVLILGATVGLATCGRPIKSTLPVPPTGKQLAELWTEPEPNRDLFNGVGGSRLAPDPSARYAVVDIKRGGFSSGYTVTDPAGREWSAKFPPEAATEVVASRILWGVGFHQPPIYYVASWTADKATSPNPQLPARFREKTPGLHGLDAKGEWSYYQNPFVGTRQLAGLLVLHAMLGNSDLKDGQNALYELDDTFEGAARWYVARDLGQTFGRTGTLDAPRGDIAVFEQTPFIKGVVNGKVAFDYRGRHRALFRNIVPADVRWSCERLQRLSDKQWQDAFRAGGFPPALGARFIHRMRQKIAEGLALKD